ncbi:MAG TPA: RnfH family protein [Azoarcus sp.]|nr:RnfH family protein [Azoarcus sp.]
MNTVINVEVTYAPEPHRYETVKLVLNDGATVNDAVQESGLLEKYPEIDLDGKNKVGIYAKLTKLDATLRDRDRLEIYRPLIADPKAVRRKRAEENKTAKKDSEKAEPAKT